MKKNILAIAIASATAAAMTAPVASANAPTVYGQFNVAVEDVTDQGHNVVNRNSRVGIKGSQDLGNGLSAVYQFETTVNVQGGNTGNGGWGAQRNTFVGLGGGFGTVVMGRHDTPLRMIQPSDGFADSAYAGNNTGRFNGMNFNNNLPIIGGLNVSGEHRLDNVVAYLSPSFNGVAFALAGTATPAAGEDGSLANGYSASLTYGSKADGLFAGIATTQVTDNHAGHPQLNNKDVSFIRATLQYKLSGLTVNGMYNTVDNDGTIGSSYTLGGAYKMGQFTPRAKVSMVDYNDSDLKDATNFALGVDYSLGKSTRIYAEYVTLDKNNLAGTQPLNKSTDAVSVGMVHRF